MPAKKVLQYQCDRCPRVWYVPEDKVEAPQQVLLKAALVAPAADGPVGKTYDVKFECLCEGCRKTVEALLDALGRDLKKTSSVRGARKKKGVATESAGKGEPSPTDSTTSSKPPAVAAPASPSSVPAPPVAEAAAPQNGAGGAGGSSASKGSPSAPNRPTPR